MSNLIVLYNPHIDDFLGTPFHFLMLRRTALKKYGFLIPAIIKYQDKLLIYIDGNHSILIPAKLFKLLPEIFRLFICKFEYGIWRWINNIKKYKIIHEYEIESKSYLLFAFSYKLATGDFSNTVDVLKKFKTIVFHLSHYGIATREKSENIRKLNNVRLAGDSDISSNYYFNEFFQWYKEDFLVLPFAVKERFRTSKDFCFRLDKCLAVGTVHDLSKEKPASLYADYILTTGKYAYHSVRKDIYDNRINLSNEFHSIISMYKDYDNNFFYMAKILHIFVRQQRYFAIDIVEQYNNYRFAIVAEEEIGFPALGMFEAMACGCVVFADPTRILGLNFIPYVDYIPYDGSLSGLLNSLNESNTRDDLSNISINAKSKVIKNFNEDSVSLHWINTLANL